jgi:hypothetical protein
MGTTGAPWNIPYADPSDLVRAWPALSEDVAEAVADGLDAANVGIGKNVVQTVLNTAFASSTAGYVDVTGLAVTITPSTATSKVLVIVTIGLLGNGSAQNTLRSRVQLVRDSTAIERFGGLTLTDNRDATSPAFAYLDSPATTSATVYKVQLDAGSGTGYVNRTGVDSTAVTSTITAIEVAV